MNKFLLSLSLFLGLASLSGLAASAPLKLEPNAPVATNTSTIDSADGVVTLPYELAADNSGKAMTCSSPIMGICPAARLVTPEQAIKALYPRATYLGFRLVRSKDIDRLAIYYKTNK